MRLSRTLVSDATIANTAVAYVDGQQIGSPVTLEALACEGFLATLMNLTLIDSNAQGGAIDLMLFDSLPALSSVNVGAFALTAVTESAKLLGILPIATTDYRACGATKAATVRGISQAVKAPTGTAIYVVAVARGSITYTAASALKIRAGFFQD